MQAPARACATHGIVPVALSLLGAAFLTLPVAAQTPIVPLDTLIANRGSVTAGDVTFGNFQKPKVLPQQVGILLGEFNDIGVSATANADGTVSLNFVGIDPATGLASPLIVGPTAAGEIIRLIGYTATVNNPALRLHSVAQSYGPETLVTTSETAAINLLYGVEPAIVAFFGALYPDNLRWDVWQSPLITPAVPVYQTLLPGGNLSTYNMENEFGFIKGHLGFPPGGTLDSISVTLSLVPAGTPVPPVVVNLRQAGDPVNSTWPNAFLIDPSTGVVQFFLTNFAQDGGAVITLTSSNPAALPVPPTVTVPQGNWISAPVALGPPNVDFPTVVTLTAAFNGRTQTQDFTANPPAPLAITTLFTSTLICGAQPCTLSTLMRFELVLNRTNVSTETIALTSSNPAVCPIQSTITVPAFTAGGLNLGFNITCKPVAVDTPITYSATLNGTTTTYTAILFKSTDTVAIGRAELVVKNLSLRVDASSAASSDVLTLFNAATGQLIGTMTLTGLNGTGGKYSFQGTVPTPVTTLLLKSSLNGMATGAVVQK